MRFYLLGTSIGFLEISARGQKLASFLFQNLVKVLASGNCSSSVPSSQLRVLQASITMLLVKYGMFASKRARFGREGLNVSVTYFPYRCFTTELSERSIFDMAGS